VKAARTRALNKRRHPKGAVHSQHAAKPAKRAKPAAKTAKAARSPVKRTAAQAKTAHARALSPGALACCTAEALAVSARLAGHPVSDAEVINLYRLTAGAPDEGAPILATLEAAAEFGLAGVRPASFRLAGPGETGALILGLDLPEGRHSVALDASGDVWSWGALYALGAETEVEEAWLVEWPQATIRGRCGS